MSASRERYDELGLYDVAFDDVIQLEARYATQYGQLGRLTVRRAFEARTGNGTRPPKSPSAPVAWDGRNAV